MVPQSHLCVDNVTEFVNPGRGWYHHMGTAASSYSPLEYDALLQLRNTEGYSIILRLFTLDSFKSQMIDNSTLDKIAADFDVARRAFFKLVIRFAYTETLNDPPPRGDAPKAIILQHIAQLSPILHSHSDIILAIQHGFIGTWGEGFYTDYFGDNGTINATQQQDRQDVYNALLSDLAECTMVQVRTWQFKERLTGSSLPVMREDAYMCGTGSAASSARTGLHDDCFLASDTDYGTWVDSVVDRPRMSDQSLYSIYGGETCNPSSNRISCSTALHDLRFFHFTFLNNVYHPEVLQRWRTDGCYDTVARHLGYRIILVSSVFPDYITMGSNMTFQITVRNDGFTAPMNRMVLNLVLEKGNVKHRLQLSTDVRFWLGNGTEHSINESVYIPNELNSGIWRLFLEIADAAPRLQGILQYNILAVNQVPAVQETGMNDLLRSIQVNALASESPPPTSQGTGTRYSTALMVLVALLVLYIL